MSKDIVEFPQQDQHEAIEQSRVAAAAERAGALAMSARAHIATFSEENIPGTLVAGIGGGIGLGAAAASGEAVAATGLGVISAVGLGLNILGTRVRVRRRTTPRE